MALFIKFLIYGLSTGSIYGLVAFGFVLVYKATRILNFALGDFLTLGAFLLWTLSFKVNLPFGVIILMGMGLASLLGLAAERFALRPMIGQSVLPMILVTLGVSSFLGGVTTMFFAGPVQKYPDWIPNLSFVFGDVAITPDMLAPPIIAMAVFLFFTFFFRHTRVGLDMRAVAENQKIAQAVGVKVTSVFSLTWVLAAVINMLGGLVLGTVQGISLGLLFIGIKVFPVILLGGLESFVGAVIGGLIIGVAETLSIVYIEPVIGGGFSEVVPYIIMIIVLFFKPYGLFGLKRIERI